MCLNDNTVSISTAGWLLSSSRDGGNIHMILYLFIHTDSLTRVAEIEHLLCRVLFVPHFFCHLPGSVL